MDDQVSETSITTVEGDEEFKPDVKWVNPQVLNAMTFIGRDVIAVGHDIYISFLNLKTGSELVHVVNSAESGDGVDALAGHKSTVFCYAEKVKAARIFIMIYPSFSILAELKDTEVNRYKALCMMDGDMVAGFSGFPNYLVSVWNWRAGTRLLSLPTGIVRRHQLYSSSRVGTLMCHSWGDGLCVWEVAPCYRECLALRRSQVPLGDWDVPPPSVMGQCWALEGGLYTVDHEGKLYAITCDGIHMISELEWAPGVAGSNTPSVCAFGPGLMVYGPDDQLRWLKRGATSWAVAWAAALGRADPVERLVSAATGEVAAVWTRAGRAYRVVLPDDGRDPELALVAYKQRNIKSLQMIAPDYTHVATVSDVGLVCIYEMYTGRLAAALEVLGEDVTIASSPTEAVLAVAAAAAGTGGTAAAPAGPSGPAAAATAAAAAAAALSGATPPPQPNYGVVLLRWEPAAPAPAPAAAPAAGAAPAPATGGTLRRASSRCLTYQIVSRIVFSPSGREMIAAAMSAGHVFVFKVAEDCALSLVRYAEVGRGLADCFLASVGGYVRAFILVLFSDKYAIGERIVCINAETGKDNKVAGKMAGPYAKLVPLAARDSLLAVPHLSRQMHVLRLSGDKGVTVTVRMGPMLETGHELRAYGAYRNDHALLTFGADGFAILRRPDAPPDYEWRMVCGHRYEGGVRLASVDPRRRWVVALGASRALAAAACTARAAALAHRAARWAARLDWDVAAVLEAAAARPLLIATADEKNQLEVMEARLVREEAHSVAVPRAEALRALRRLQARLLQLLEENLAEPPLHQLSLAEFNLHLEAKKERLKQAEKEREQIRIRTEARIRAQDRVSAWIRRTCWDCMLQQRVRLCAIYSHYEVENYPVLPAQRELWPELQQTAALRAVEMERDADLWRPWEERAPAAPAPAPAGGGEPAPEPAAAAEAAPPAPPAAPPAPPAPATRDSTAFIEGEEQGVEKGLPYVLSGTGTHNYIPVPAFMIPQTMAFSFLQMNWLQQIIKLNVQNMRLWFNKQFNELMTQKKREMGLVFERNARLRFIIDELNKLSDLRGSFHHLAITITDPVWRQEEEPLKLIKVEPEECSIPPYVSPSQIVLVPPEGGPKDDFRERALMDMMDGVLEKLWHEEIKKDIPKPQVMLEKEPEHFTEDDLRLVFEYEARVAFREEERAKYRKMLHAEYARLTQVFNEGIVKFNMKVKDMWLSKLRVDSVMAQENLNLQRLRRVNLDRVEAAEEIEAIRAENACLEQELAALEAEAGAAAAAGAEATAAYDALAAKDRQMERSFKNAFGDLPQVVIDQCYKYFKKRPKWHQRATMTPGVLNELAQGIASGVRPAFLHPDVSDFFKGCEAHDQMSNMPPVMDEQMFLTMCRLRRVKIENEIRMKALVAEVAMVEAGSLAWARAIAARRARVAANTAALHTLRERRELLAIDRTVQLVLPAGQVEVATTGHIEDFECATLLPRDDIETINNLILRVGDMKLRMMRKQMEFRKGILAKEWEHAQMKMKLRHMEQELYSYRRLKIPKELQAYLKNKEQGHTDETDYQKLEREMAATKMAFSRVLADNIQRVEEMQVKLDAVAARTAQTDKAIVALNVKVSEKRLKEDPLEPIRIRRVLKKRMETLVARSRLVREAQARHARATLLQTELELLRLRTFPTLATFRTFC